MTGYTEGHMLLLNVCNFWSTTLCYTILQSFHQVVTFELDIPQAFLRLNFEIFTTRHHLEDTNILSTLIYFETLPDASFVLKVVCKAS